MLKTIQSWGQKVLAFKKAYVEGRSGATAIEYGLIAAGIAIVIVATITIFKDDLKGAFTNIGSAMGEAPDTFG
jgi:pilus assembly protein Flp/PilA